MAFNLIRKFITNINKKYKIQNIMCLILFAYKARPGKKLILAANRDEFFARPTAAMDFWHDNPSILAGRDLKEGGTWLGMNRNGKFAALTNYRDPASVKNNLPSRGQIIKDYLTSNNSAADFLEKLQKQADSFNGFNLVLSDENSLFWFSNQGGKPEQLGPGIYGLSNHLLNTPWPKIKKGRKALEKTVLNKENLSAEALFHLLENKSIPHDSELPDTGVGIEWERILAPIFINSKDYGTRSSSVIIMNNDGHAFIAERGFNEKGALQYEKEFYI